MLSVGSTAIYIYMCEYTSSRTRTLIHTLIYNVVCTNYCLQQYTRMDVLYIIMYIIVIWEYQLHHKFAVCFRCPLFQPIRCKVPQRI